LVATVIHDGDPEVLGRHLALEVDRLVEAWGNDLAELTAVTGVEVVAEGDAQSPNLPAIPGEADRGPTTWRRRLAELEGEVAELRRRVEALEAAGGGL
jgi:hypothetical protein